MRFLAFLVLSSGLAAAAEPGNLISNPVLKADDTGAAPAWSYWSPRPDLAQEHAVVTREGGATLMLRSRDFASYGFWFTRVATIEGGKFYHFEACHQTDGMRDDTGGVFAVLSWYAEGAAGRELQRDYIDRQDREGRWLRMSRTVQAPRGAASVRIEMGLRRTDAGTVYWRDPQFAEVSAPPPRIVRVATTRIIAATPPTIAANIQRMADMLDRVGLEKPDIVLMSENLNTRGVRLPLAEKAQTIPGPFTAMLSGKAKQFGMHVITTLPERDGRLFHNTAVWIDRTGRIAGKYHKVHLTIGEMESGLTPGNEYPVFETDFGRIGIVTCWDNWFQEPMRILRLRGAEIVFMPLAGDGDPAHWNAVWPARAIDNGVYLVTSSTVGETQSRIINPKGTIIAEAKEQFAYAIAEIDLNQEWRLRYLSVGNGEGEAKSVYLRERRPETYDPLLKDSEPRADTKPGG